MTTGTDDDRTDDHPRDERVGDFVGLLNQLKTAGCNVLVVGDATRPIFTQASSQLFGGAESVRYRTLAVTDADADSITRRLPDPETTNRPLGETTHVLNHTGAPRSITETADATLSPALSSVRETRIADPRLDGLQSALVESISEFASRVNDLQTADIRVCVDSLRPLLEYYDRTTVRRCLRMVGGHVHEHDAMAHYVLMEDYESEIVQTLAEDVDAVVELRVVDPVVYGHEAQQRWHVPEKDLSLGWISL